MIKITRFIYTNNQQITTIFSQKIKEITTITIDS